MLAKKLDKKTSIKLTDVNAGDHGDIDKAEGTVRLTVLSEQLADLQYLMYAAGTHALLVVLQGRDTSGKDGTLKAIAGAMNPVGVDVASFKKPTTEELSHDFLWRVHRQVPAKGAVVFFNRSHYEDVLAVRVHNLAPEKVWRKRFDHINAFEELLHDANVVVVKFFLHVSKKEQEERLLAREAEVEKAWKLNPGDWEEREKWNAYTEAYEDVLRRCAVPHAPWYVVPADHKWFRNVAVAESLVETLRPFREQWEADLEEMGLAQRKALEEMRAGKTSSV